MYCTHTVFQYILAQNPSSPLLGVGHIWTPFKIISLPQLWFQNGPEESCICMAFCMIIVHHFMFESPHAPCSDLKHLASFITLIDYLILPPCMKCAILGCCITNFADYYKADRPPRSPNSQYKT